MIYAIIELIAMHLLVIKNISHPTNMATTKQLNFFMSLINSQ